MILNEENRLYTVLEVNSLCASKNNKMLIKYSYPVTLKEVEQWDIVFQQKQPSDDEAILVVL